MMLMISCNPPDKEIKYYIDTWKIEGKMQTIASDQAYFKLFSLDRKEVYQIISECKEYIQRYPDERIQLRLAIIETYYIRFGKQVPDMEDYRSFLLLLPKCQKLGDQQILAELYTIISDYSPPNEFINYVLRANSLMEKIGIQYFPGYKQRLYSIGFTLYLNQEYRQSLIYLQKAFKITNSNLNYNYNASYVLVNDLAAACYRELNMYDSSLYHYKMLLQNANLPVHASNSEILLWKAITKGNIAYLLAQSGHSDLAKPYLLKHLRQSQLYKDNHNMAIVYNRMGQIDLFENRLNESLMNFQTALKFAKNTNFFKQRKIATKGISDIYHLENKTDSLYKYFYIYKAYDDTINEMKVAYNLETAEAKLAFDAAESRLTIANNDIKRMRLIRNFIIVFVIMISIIAYRYFTRRIFEQKDRAERLESDKTKALSDTEKALGEIQIFKKKIIENEAMISKLHDHILDKNDLQPEMDRIIKYALIDKNELEKFNLEFEIANPQVLPGLDGQSKPLSPAERRLAALIYLKLNNEQISHALGISKDSVTRSKRRLKNALKLDPDQGLEEFILQF